MGYIIAGALIMLVGVLAGAAMSSAAHGSTKKEDV